MLIAKINSQHISRFTYDFHILHDSKITHTVSYELLIADALRKLHRITGILKDILQSPLVSSLLSHKSGFCLYRQS